MRGSILGIVNLVLNGSQHISVNLKSSGIKIQVLVNCFIANNHYIDLFLLLLIIMHTNKLRIHTGSHIGSNPLGTPAIKLKQFCWVLAALVSQGRKR